MASPQRARRSWFKAKNWGGKKTKHLRGFEGEREVRVHRLQHACCLVKGNNNGTPGITSLPNPGLQPRDLLYLIDKTVRSVPARDALGWVLADIQCASVLRRSLLLIHAHIYVLHIIAEAEEEESVLSLCNDSYCERSSGRDFQNVHVHRAKIGKLDPSSHIVKLSGTSRKDWNPAQHIKITSERLTSGPHLQQDTFCLYPT